MAKSSAYDISPQFLLPSLSLTGANSFKLSPPTAYGDCVNACATTFAAKQYGADGAPGVKDLSINISGKEVTVPRPAYRI